MNKLNPSRLDWHTLGGIQNGVAEGDLEGLYAVCGSRVCAQEREKLFVRLDLDALVVRFGRSRWLKTLKPKCQVCEAKGRDAHFCSFHVRAMSDRKPGG